MKPESLSDCERHLDDLKSGQSPARSNWQSIDVIEFLLSEVNRGYLIEDAALKPKTLESIVQKHCNQAR